MKKPDFEKKMAAVVLSRLTYWPHQPPGKSTASHPDLVYASPPANPDERERIDIAFDQLGIQPAKSWHGTEGNQVVTGYYFTKTEITKLIRAGVKSDVLDVYAEALDIKRPQSHVSRI